MGRAMPPLPLHSVSSWHVRSRSLSFTFTNTTFMIDVVKYLGELNIREKYVNNTSASVKNFKMEKEYVS